MTIKQQGGIFGRNPTFNDVAASVVEATSIDTSDIDITSTAANPLSIVSTNASGAYATFNNGTQTSLFAGFGSTLMSGATANDAVLRYDSNDNLYIARGSAKVATFNSSGSLEIANGSLVISTAGGGIDFSATSGTGTSELFSDYEEGSWTPDYSNWTTSPTVYGGWASYTKIGRQVFIQIRGYGGTNNAGIAITNLPFTPSEQPYGTGLAVGTSGEAGFEGTFTASGLVISSNSAPYWWGFSGTYFTS